MASWPVDRSGFQVHVGERMEPEHREGLGQLLRYQTRPPVDLVRLQYDEASDVVQYRTRKGHDLEWSHPTAFLADFCQHVPEPRSARVSYHGYLANCKGNLSQDSEAEVEGKAEERDPPASGRRRSRIPWGLLVWRVWNTDVERCPGCRQEMTRTAVLVERAELLRLLGALRIQAPPCRPPPVPSRSSPPRRSRAESGGADTGRRPGPPACPRPTATGSRRTRRGVGTTSPQPSP
jgi:hypothetical protein